MTRLLPLLPLLALACEPEPEPLPETPDDTDPGTRAITLRFRGEVAGRNASCQATFPAVGASDSAARLTDLRLYVHDVRLLLADGAEVPLALDQDAWQGDGVALIDLETGDGTCVDGTPEVHEAITGTAPDLPYTGVAFRLGVPAHLNHVPLGEAGPPLDVPVLHRNPVDGYWFLRTGFRSPDPWPVWLGSTGCTAGQGGAAACTSENVTEVVLDGLDPDVHVVVIEVDDLVDRANLDTNASAPGTGILTPEGCQSVVGDPDCNGIWPAWGIGGSPRFLHVGD